MRHVVYLLVALGFVQRICGLAQDTINHVDHSPLGPKVLALQELLAETSENEVPREFEEEKRAGWKSLQGSWGKRENELKDGWNDDQSTDEEKRGKWSKLHGSWGKRKLDLLNSRGLRDELELRATGGNDPRLPLNRPSSEQQDELGFIAEKRLWPGFLSSWNKRRTADTRTIISPRSTNWSSLRGSWGKRSSRALNWNQLRGAWGKRDEDDIPSWEYSKGTFQGSSSQE